MNKKGFTLTELLAVIVILAVVSLIGTVSITGVKRKMNENMFRNKLAEVISAVLSGEKIIKKHLLLMTQTGIHILKKP